MLSLSSRYSVRYDKALYSYVCNKIISNLSGATEQLQRLMLGLIIVRLRNYDTESRLVLWPHLHASLDPHFTST